MKNSLLFKSLFLGVFLTLVTNSCSVNDEVSSSNVVHVFSKNENQILFSKSPNFDWVNKQVEVSFEDNFEKFSEIDPVSNKGIKMGFSLSDNNLKQGITIKLKVTESNSVEYVNEIMIESYDLSQGKNEITIGYIDNKPYIIY